MNGIVFDIKEFAVYDGPGIRTTVFLKGCPLRCRWCHNPEGLSPKPQRMLSADGSSRIAGTEWTSAALAGRLLKDRAILEASGGGVTFSGGEPLLQWPFVREVAEQLDGLHTCIETSGYASDDVFRDMMAQIGLIMMDIKLVDAPAHKRWTGVDNAPILRHAEMLCQGDTPFIIRLPLIPGANDTEAHMRDVAQLVKGAPMLQRVELLPYHHTAGAKYPLVGMDYLMDIDVHQTVQLHTAPLEEAGIEWKVL